jgi:hypothetical protein
MPDRRSGRYPVGKRTRAKGFTAPSGWFNLQAGMSEREKLKLRKEILH